MITRVVHNNVEWKIDLEKAIDISIPLISGQEGPNCFYAPPYETSPVVSGDFIGDRSQGGIVNFFNVKINPHGNGTHTECVGHISEEKFKLRDCMQRFHFFANLISVDAFKLDNGDKLITKESILSATAEIGFREAMILRTKPNDEDKLAKVYSGTNPVYFDPDAIKLLVDNGVEHLLTDLPSVDREEDGGNLYSHKAFWAYPDEISSHRTITELIFVPNYVKDGPYFLNIMVGNYDLDVSPSKPVLYKPLWTTDI